MSTEKADKPTPPVVSFKTYKTFIRSLAAAIPSRIDKSVMRSMSGGTQTQIVHALKSLGLIDAQGVPQPKLLALVKSEGAEYQKAFQEVLRATYPFLSEKGFNLETATDKQLDEQFAKLAGGDTVRKCKTFFLPAAKDAGMKVSTFIKEVGKRAPSNGPKPKKARATGNLTATTTPPSAASAATSTLSWHELLLSKFPSFDPAWPDQVKAKWFESFQDLMQRGSAKEGK